MGKQIDFTRSQIKEGGMWRYCVRCIRPAGVLILFDLNHYAEEVQVPRGSVFTIGGGVPPHQGAASGPVIEISNTRLGLNMSSPRFHYGVRICPEPDYWGG